MLKQLILDNWKSFHYAELPIDPLTVLIGSNASGKSNVVEALEFLQRIVRGEDVEAALAGDKTLPSIRGGVEWAARKPENQFTLKVVIHGDDELTDYIYSVTVQTQPIVQIITERIDSLIIENNNFSESKTLLELHNISNSGIVSFKKKKRVQFPVNHIALEGLSTLVLNENVESNLVTKTEDDQEISRIEKLNHQIYKVKKNIENIFFINPLPYNMRNYSRLSMNLESDASNIAGVLAALHYEQKNEIESTLSTYAKDLLEGNVQKVWAEKIGRFGTDAMLYCEEILQSGQNMEIDARSMSDGTLRFLAILTALLTRPEGSQVIIEEVDSGLHPSRVEILVRMLREIGEKRKIDILFTTYNPALLDALGAEIVPFVVIAHRDSNTGDSQLTVLEDIQNFSKLFASASLGKLTTNGALERSLSRHK
jgi:predicted ATPase